MRKSVNGFTIVELLIVIVVIAILAAISIVAYNGIQDRARSSASQSAVRQAANKAAVYMAENDACAPSLTTLGISNSADTKYQYSCNTTPNPDVYCVTADVSGQLFYVDSAVRPTPTSGVCSTYNFLLWNEADGPAPVPNSTIDSTVYRTATSSIRLGPGEVGRGVLNSPYSGQPGQVYAVSLWIRTDSNWNGTGGNSKIRFGSVVNGAPLHVCGYQGIKTSWTFVTCSYTLTAAETGVHISVGNDGTVGNIWLDDFTLTRSY